MNNSIEDFIKRALPNVSDGERSSLRKHLQSLGLSSTEDLIYLKEEDVVEHLKPFPLRRFLQFCRNGWYRLCDKQICFSF